jgi:hypothetical protein
MENEFEKYLQQNRERFENGVPSPRVWEKLQRDLIEREERRHGIIRMQRISWAAAACIIIAVGVFFLIPKKQATKDVEKVTNISPLKPHDSTDSSDAAKLLAEKRARDMEWHLPAMTDEETRQSIYYYAKLIGIRQKQLSRIQQVNPDLYARSQKAIVDLEQMYNHLKKQLPGSVDQQKVLKQMIQNLQMQEQILNNQLQLIESMQSPNQSADENKKDI